MSDLTYIERSRLEKLFGMGSGYVLNFSNRTCQEFVSDSVRRDIYCGKYDYASCSKANLLRRFWEVEPNHVAGKLINDLIEIAKEEGRNPEASSLFGQCRKIAERLLQGAPVNELDSINENLAERDMELLVKSIRSSIDANEPETGLDRLHTFVTKFLRRLCEAKGISTIRRKPLHSLLGEYIKKMKAEGAIESQMTERILKSSIGNLEAFNSVRNEQSFAHDNPVLNYEESLLIFNNVMGSIRFIQALDRKRADKIKKESEINDWDGEIPF